MFNKVYKHDARQIDELITVSVVDVTITSPPYFDMKDYGHPKQIGYGQDYEQYLKDITRVFKGVFRITKDTGSLWVIIDTFRSDNQIVPLPFDVAKALQSIGWKFKDIIIWKKDRTVPWVHSGQTRSTFEYILLFTKQDIFNFYVDRVRDIEGLKKWWVKYPERYNPKGKAPEEIWEFGIPIQGAWGEGYIRHFCPLPEELVQRILMLTTNEESVVLDPFAGSGTVLAQALFSKRKFIGLELNQDYIAMFKKYIRDHQKEKQAKYSHDKNHSISRNDFETLILNLRALKFAKLVLKSCKTLSNIFVEKLDAKPEKKHKLLTVRYVLLITDDDIDTVQRIINEIVSKPPLSKFGISHVFEIHTQKTTFEAAIPSEQLFFYTAQKAHKFASKGTVSLLANQYPICSSIGVELNENDFE